MIGLFGRFVNEYHTLIVVIVGVLVICFLYWWFFCKDRPLANKVVGGDGSYYKLYEGMFSWRTEPIGDCYIEKNILIPTDDVFVIVKSIIDEAGSALNNVRLDEILSSFTARFILDLEHQEDVVNGLLKGGRYDLGSSFIVVDGGQPTKFNKEIELKHGKEFYVGREYDTAFGPFRGFVMKLHVFYPSRTGISTSENRYIKHFAASARKWQSDVEYWRLFAEKEEGSAMADIYPASFISVAAIYLFLPELVPYETVIGKFTQRDKAIFDDLERLYLFHKEQPAYFMTNQCLMLSRIINQAWEMNKDGAAKIDSSLNTSISNLMLVSGYVNKNIKFKRTNIKFMTHKVTKNPEFIKLLDASHGRRRGKGLYFHFTPFIFRKLEDEQEVQVPKTITFTRGSQTPTTQPNTFNTNRMGWSKEEDQKIATYISKMGVSCLKPLAMELGRTIRQVRERWKYNISAEFTQKWNDDHDDVLFEKVLKFGTRWNLVANFLGGKSAEDCKNRWYHIILFSERKNKMVEHLEEIKDHKEGLYLDVNQELVEDENIQKDLNPGECYVGYTTKYGFPYDEYTGDILGKHKGAMERAEECYMKEYGLNNNGLADQVPSFSVYVKFTFIRTLTAEGNGA